MAKTIGDANAINKILFKNEERYRDFVLTLVEQFPSVEHFENHFKMTPYDEETHPEEYMNGILRPETMKFKPKSYPCFYIWFPMYTDDCRGFGGASGWFDEFVYLTDF